MIRETRIPDTQYTPDFPGRLVTTIGQGCLAGGFACLAGAAGLWQFVIVGLLGLALLPLALGLLLAGGILVRGEAVPAGRAALGLLLFIVGLVVLTLTAAEATGRACAEARYALSPIGQPPVASPWLVIVLGSLATALILGLGIRLRSGWSMGWVLLWALVVLLVCPGAVLLFFGLAPVLPLDA